MSLPSPSIQVKRSQNPPPTALTLYEEDPKLARRRAAGSRVGRLSPVKYTPERGPEGPLAAFSCLSNSLLSEQGSDYHNLNKWSTVLLCGIRVAGSHRCPGQLPGVSRPLRYHSLLECSAVSTIRPDGWRKGIPVRFASLTADKTAMGRPLLVTTTPRSIRRPVQNSADLPGKSRRVMDFIYPAFHRILLVYTIATHSKVPSGGTQQEIQRIRRKTRGSRPNPSYLGDSFFFHFLDTLADS